MKKIEILTAPILSKPSHNQGYAIYVEGKKVWESKSHFDAPQGEQIKVDDLLHALGFKMHVVEVTDKVIDDNYGIFPDELEELNKYSKEEKFEQEKLQNEKFIPGDDYRFDDIYYSEEIDDDSFIYDDNYDLPEFEHESDSQWSNIDDEFLPDDDDFFYE